MSTFIVAPKAKAVKPIKVRCPNCAHTFAFSGNKAVKTSAVLGRDQNVDYGGEKAGKA